MSSRMSVAAAYVAAITAAGIHAYTAAPRLNAQDVARESSGRAAKDATEFATSTRLPSLGPTSAALGVNEDGTVIAGHSYDRGGMLHAVKWTLQNGRWVITKLPYDGSAVGRAVNNAGDVAGYTDTEPRRAVLWPATGGSVALGCDGDQTMAHAVSAHGQVVVGQVWAAVVGQANSPAAVWQSPQGCRESLPSLSEGAARAYSVNGDGTIVGGVASDSFGNGVPVRWTRVGDEWTINQLDTRPGLALAANADGNLAGQVSVSCNVAAGCVRAAIWYVAQGPRQLATLGGADSWARGINAAEEVVGLSTLSNGVNTAFFWSQARGMVALPVKGRSAGAYGVSNVRSDGTRLVVGADSQGDALVWVVRNP